MKEIKMKEKEKDNNSKMLLGTNTSAESMASSIFLKYFLSIKIRLQALSYSEPQETMRSCK